MANYPWHGNRNPLAVSAGQLRHQISIQAQSTAQDPDTGEPASVWNTTLTTWAQIETLTAREAYQAGASQFVAQVTHMVTIRWPGASVRIAGGMRVLFGERMFMIQAVDNVQERNRLLKLACLEVNGGNGGSGCS